MRVKTILCIDEIEDISLGSGDNATVIATESLYYHSSVRKLVVLKSFLYQFRKNSINMLDI